MGYDSVKVFKIHQPDNDKTGACILSTYLHPDSVTKDDNDRLKCLLSEGIQRPINADRLAEIERMYAESRNTTLTQDYVDTRTEASANCKSRMFTGLQPNDFRIQYTTRLVPHRYIPESWTYSIPNHRGTVIESILFELKELNNQMPKIEKISIFSNSREIATYTGSFESSSWSWNPFPCGFPGYLAPYCELYVVVEFVDKTTSGDRHCVVKAVVSMPCTDESEIREPAKTTLPTFVRTEDSEKLVCIVSGTAIPVSI